MKKIDVFSESELSRVNRLKTEKTVPHRGLTARDYFCIVYVALIGVISVLGLVLLLLSSTGTPIPPEYIICCGAALMAVCCLGGVFLEALG